MEASRTFSFIGSSFAALRNQFLNGITTSRVGCAKLGLCRLYNLPKFR